MIQLLVLYEMNQLTSVSEEVRNWVIKHSNNFMMRFITSLKTRN